MQVTTRLPPTGKLTWLLVRYSLLLQKIILSHFEIKQKPGLNSNSKRTSIWLQCQRSMFGWMRYLVWENQHVIDKCDFEVFVSRENEPVCSFLKKSRLVVSVLEKSWIRLCIALSFNKLWNKANCNLNSIGSKDHLFFPCGQADVFCFAAECGLGDLAGTSGFLTSPNFPNNFPRNTECTSTITVPAGLIIKLTFLNFTLEPNQQTDCTGSPGGARVFITNVASDDGAALFRLCGQNIPNPVFSVGNFIQVRLLSLNIVVSGFKAFYEAISADDCKLAHQIPTVKPALSGHPFDTH